MLVNGLFLNKEKEGNPSGTSSHFGVKITNKELNQEKDKKKAREIRSNGGSGKRFDGITG